MYTNGALRGPETSRATPIREDFANSAGLPLLTMDHSAKWEYAALAREKLFLAGRERGLSGARCASIPLNTGSLQPMLLVISTLARSASTSPQIEGEAGQASSTVVQES